MDVTQKLLYSSLMHIPFISQKEENAYWGKGICDLSQLWEVLYSKDTLFIDLPSDLISKSIEDISNGRTNEILSELSKKSGSKDFYRVAYSYPEDVMFLDIETTGLSQIYHYVTLIGWMISGSYHYWLPGMDNSVFLNTFKRVKLIITFNGVKFDCPFIKKTFNHPEVSVKPNIDLMYLCRSFDYTKGQKNIEREMGFKRPDEITDCNGKEAIALWYKFLFGDNSALNKLIAYNFYDILGMLFILDNVFFKHIYGKIFPNAGSPSCFFSSAYKNNNSIDSAIASGIRDYVKMNISNFDMRKLSSAANYKIVGIDLAGVINKTSKTGICLLYGQIASTEIVKDNDDILDYIKKKSPDIISIDAPLSLPNGRVTVYNDDPNRKDAGIMRFCERVLKRRGVNVYPALIDSMQELTKRGMELSQKLRKLGYPVIECFPGAAQDVLQLPRKRTDETLLKTGLLRLGIHGDFESKKVFHDELDAITAALVGQFFIAEYYEEIGIMEENDLIIPGVKKTNPQYDAILGIAGPIATGKTTTAQYLSNKGYEYCRYSQVLEDGLEEGKKSVDRQSLQEAGWQMFSNVRQYELSKKLEKRILGSKRVVIDGLRHYEDYTYWKERSFSRFSLLYIDTDYNLCSLRYSKTNPGEDYNKAVKHPVEEEVAGLKQCADYIISNNGDIDDLHAQIESISVNISQSMG
jgi:uncharacterized protein YprB with RNaseH-like and TPR domain/predicted nuclease with RNAse H fold/dephospho-CoA kinase